MNIFKNVRSIRPIPKDWERDSDRRNFAMRIESALQLLFTRKYVAGIRMNGTEVTGDPDSMVDLRQIVRYQFSVPNNGTRTLTIGAGGTGSYTFLMIAAANSASNRGMWIVNKQGSNSTTSVDVIKSASNLTITAGATDNVITIEKNGTVVTNVVLFLVYPVTSNGPEIVGS